MHAGSVRRFGPGSGADLTACPLVLLRLLMIVRERMIRVRGGSGGRARRWPLRLLLLLLLLGAARYSGSAGRRAGRGRCFVIRGSVGALLLLLVLYLRGRRLRASGTRHRLEKTDQRLLSPAHRLDDSRRGRVREYLSLVFHQGELVFALGVRHETLRVAEAQLAYEAHQDRFDRYRGGGRWWRRRRRGRLFAALRASVTYHSITVHHGQISIMLLRGRALLLLLLLLLVSLVRVQSRHVVRARDLRKYKRMRDRDTAAVHDATVWQRIVLAQLALSLDDVRRPVRIVHDLPVKFFHVATCWAGTRAWALLLLLLLLLALRLHGHGGGGGGRCCIRDRCGRWYGVAGAGFRARGWTGRPGVVGLV